MRNLIVFVIYSIFALIVTFPLVLHLNSSITDRYDGLLITWIINWVAHSWSLSANIFYPYQNTLAFSDFHFLSALFAVPILSITRQPLAAYNFNILLALSLTGFSGYLLANFLTKKPAVSFLAGTLLGFSTIHLNYLPHLQLLHLWPVVLTTYFLLADHKKSFVLFFILSVLNSPLNFYFLLLICSFSCRRFRWLIAATLLSVPILLPYYFVSRQFNYQRPITDAIHFSLQFPDLANVSSYSRLSTFAAQLPNATPAYFGAVFLALLLSIFFKFQPPKNPHFNFFIALAAASFVLALGPALHIFRDTVHLGPLPAIPLPYAALYYLVPGFSGFRTPSRWILLTSVALVFALAIYFAKRINWPWAILLSALVIAEVNFPFKYYQVPDYPPEQIWLKDNFVGAPIIQFPIYAWFDGENVGQETLREYYSTIHWHPMFNGYSGFSPTEWENRVRYLQKNFPSPETMAFLRSLQIKLVLAPSSWQIPLKLVAEFPDTKIYDLSSSAGQN